MCSTLGQKLFYLEVHSILILLLLISFCIYPSRKHSTNNCSPILTDYLVQRNFQFHVIFVGQDLMYFNHNLAKSAVTQGLQFSQPESLSKLVSFASLAVNKFSDSSLSSSNSFNMFLVMGTKHHCTLGWV